MRIDLHALLHDVPLEDAWAIPLSGGGAGRTIQDLRAVMVAGRQAAPAVVQFEDEQLSELRNATVHAFASLSIRQTPGGYLAYLGVFVQPVHRFTRLYMGAIAPFRRLVVYPSVIRKMQSAWTERYGGESGVEGRLTV